MLCYRDSRHRKARIRKKPSWSARRVDRRVHHRKVWLNLLPQMHTPWKKRFGLLVFGVVALYFAGSWAKKRFVDSDRVLIGVHALDGEEAVVMVRDEGGESPIHRIAKIRIGNDEALWERDVGALKSERTKLSNGMSVAGGHAVILHEVSETHVEVVAYDLRTGEIAWQRPLPKTHAAEILGRDRFVFIDAGQHLYLLERGTGSTIREWQGQGQSIYAFTDTWIQTKGGSAIEYVEVESGHRRRLEEPLGPVCRIEDRVYGLFGSLGLVSYALSTGDRVEVASRDTLAQDESDAAFLPWSCGWRRNPDSSLRLVFASPSPGRLVAIDLDPTAPQGSGELAWAHTFEGAIETGVVRYWVRNQLDLVLFGEVPRFVPLDVRLSDAPKDANHQIVLLDTVDGEVIRQGTPGRRSFFSFGDGATVFMVVEGRNSSERWSDALAGHVLAMDAQTAETHAVSLAGKLRVDPASVAAGAVWTWVDGSLSRSHNLGLAVFDRQLDLVKAGGAKRVPASNADVIASLLGPDSIQP